jgi:hypothetical protein
MFCLQLWKYSRAEPEPRTGSRPLVYKAMDHSQLYYYDITGTPQPVFKLSRWWAERESKRGSIPGTDFPFLLSSETISKV